MTSHSNESELRTLDQFSAEKSSKLKKERANTGFCSAFVKQFVVSVQALLLILFVCKSCVCFVPTFVLNSTPIHFGSVAWGPFWVGTWCKHHIVVPR